MGSRQEPIEVSRPSLRRWVATAKNQNGRRDLSDEEYLAERDALRTRLASIPDSDRVGRLRPIERYSTSRTSSRPRGRLGREELCRIVMERVVAADRRLSSNHLAAARRRLLREKTAGVPPRGFEPLISTLKGWRPRPLDDEGEGRECSRGPHGRPRTRRRDAPGSRAHKALLGTASRRRACTAHQPHWCSGAGSVSESRRTSGTGGIGRPCQEIRGLPARLVLAPAGRTPYQWRWYFDDSRGRSARARAWTNVSVARKRVAS